MDEIIFNGVRYTRFGKYFRSARKFLHRAIWESANGPIPVGHHIHHLDGDPSNNVLGNLAMLDKSRNGLLSNASYASKRAEYVKLPAFKTLEQVAAIPEWTRQTIREREKMLAAYVLEKLALPEYAAKPRIPYRDSAIPPAAAVAPDALS